MNALQLLGKEADLLLHGLSLQLPLFPNALDILRCMAAASFRDLARTNDCDWGELATHPIESFLAH